MDGTHTISYPLIHTVAYLSAIQVLSAYDSVENAKAVLGVSVICEPEILLDKTEGELPHFYEVGHA